MNMGKEWFTIRFVQSDIDYQFTSDKEWNEEKSEGVIWGKGTRYITSADAYDVAVELSFDQIKIWYHSNLDGNIRSSIVWEF